MAYQLRQFDGNRGEIYNERGDVLYYGTLPLCRKALNEWEATPLTPEDERALINAQARRTQRTWSRLLGGSSQ